MVAENTLYFGDNLDILRREIPKESVDLIYLDPPFNSRRDFNVLFRDKKNRPASAQLQSFEDFWHWDLTAMQAYEELRHKAPHDVRVLIIALHDGLGESELFAYVVMMTIRLLEMHRVLKRSGSLYLHCDPTASHYLKILMDSIFGRENYRSEIIWLRSRNPKGSQHKSIQWGGSTDTILFYSKSSESLFSIDSAKVVSTSAEVARRFPKMDDKGRWDDGPILRSDSMGPRPNLVYEYKGFTPGPAGWRVVREKLEEIDALGNLYWTTTNRPRRKLRPDDVEAEPLGNCWTDIPPINSQAQERLGYPTQKPLALLKRIIAASTCPGDVVLDPFCGCGTAVVAAQELGRRWLGIDITYLALAVIRKRLTETFPGIQIREEGDTPRDIEGARQLAVRDRFAFQEWMVGLAGGWPPNARRKRGADRGIDGYAFFVDEPNGKQKKCVIQVKSGGAVGPIAVRDLVGTVSSEHADLGALLLLDEPTPAMKQAARAAGLYTRSEWGSDRAFQRIQILTTAQLLAGKRIMLPAAHDGLKSSSRSKTTLPVQPELGLSKLPVFGRTSPVQ